jgi:hypothetical protein
MCNKSAKNLVSSSATDLLGFPSILPNLVPLSMTKRKSSERLRSTRNSNKIERDLVENEPNRLSVSPHKKWDQLNEVTEAKEKKRQPRKKSLPLETPDPSHARPSVEEIKPAPYIDCPSPAIFW